MNKDVMNISKKVVDNYNTGTFDQFYISFLEICEERLTIFFRTNTFLFDFNEEELLVNALNRLKNNLIQLGTKSLLIELEIYKKEYNVELNENKYKDFIKYITRIEFIGYFYKKYPVLFRLLNNKVETFLSLYRETIVNLNKDKNIINQKLDIDTWYLNGLEFDVGGDTHNGGKCVVKVNINNDKTLYYKPHSLSMDILFDKISLKIIKELDYTNHEFRHIRCICFESYGWQEKIEYHQCTDEIDIKNYYYSIGICLAIFYLLGTEDIHSENLIVNKNIPAFIDLEMLLSNKSKPLNGKGNHKSMKENMAYKFKNSIFATYILPMNFTNTLFDIDVCALTSGQNMGKRSNQISYFKIFDNFSSNIHYKKTYSENQETLSIVRHNNKLIYADKYIRTIISGFEDSYKVIMKSKLELLKIIKEFRINDIRQITRATYVYAKYLDAAHHPKYLMNENERLKVFQLLQGKLELSDAIVRMVDSEVNMLNNDDIPYFYTNIDSRNLYYYDGKKSKVIKNYYKNTILSGITDKMDNMCINDMYKQIDFIYYSFANFGRYKITKLESQNNFLYKYINKYKDTKNYREFFIKAIFYNIIRRIEINESSAAMFTLEMQKTDQYNINVMDSTLYNGLGVILFIGLVMKYITKLNENLLIKLINGIEELYPMESISMNIGSAYNGLVSRVYVYYILATLTESEIILQYYNNTVDYLLGMEFSDNDDIDYVNGIAGGIVACINIYMKTGDIRLKELIAKMKEFMFRKLERELPEEFLAGMSHGFSGIILSIMKLYEYEHNESLKERAIVLVNEENKLYSCNYRNWKDLRTNEYNMNYWCHGAAGIGLSRIATYQYIMKQNELEEIWKHDIDASISMIKKNGLSVEKNHGLCHGIIGNLLILQHINNTLLDNKLDDIVSSKVDEIINRSVIDGFNYQNKMNVEDINFMTGLSGIGYGMLKITNNDIPNILLLEV